MPRLCLVRGGSRKVWASRRCACFLLCSGCGEPLNTPGRKMRCSPWRYEASSVKVYSRSIVTKVEAFKAFYPAEEYHQDFLVRNPTNPYIVYNDLPKLENLKKDFPDLYKR